MKFNLKSAARVRPTKINNISCKLDDHLTEPFKKMLTDNNLSVNRAINAMIEHCLKDAGYLIKEANRE